MNNTGRVQRNPCVFGEAKRGEMKSFCCGAFIRDSPNEPRTGVDGSNFLDGRKPRCEVSMTSASQTVRTALEGVIWRFSPDIGTHSSGLLALNARPSNV